MRKPNCPTPEVARHELTHFPAAAWCEACVKGRGREAPHQDQRGSMLDSVCLVVVCLMPTLDTPLRDDVRGEGTESRGCCMRFFDLGIGSRSANHSETRHSCPGFCGQRHGRC